MALEDCRDLLQFAIGELQATKTVLQDNTINHVHDRVAELKNWLGAVFAFQQLCLDGFHTHREKQVRSQLQTGSLDHVGKVTALALDVVSRIAHVLSNFDLHLIVKPSSRRLIEVDQDGYPAWFGVTDRKLLGDVSKGGSIAPNAVVAKDGSGQFKTVLDAINAYPKNNKGRYVIYVKAGIYDEYITVDKNKKNILMYGDGHTKTIITGNKNFVDGWKTMRTATFATVAEDFIAKSIAFENTAGASKHQAVALRVQGDRSAFFDCAIRGFQDTLYAHAHRQFYRNCEISGTVDFIFGYSSTIVQSSKIIVRKPDPNQQNIVVADGTPQKNMPTGVVLQNCDISPEAELVPMKLTVKSYLARPWKEYSRAIFLENTIGDLIQPDGYLQWSGNMYLNTCFFAEYGNTGPGANVNARVKWGRGVLNKNDAAQYTAEHWIQASTWLPATSIPFDPAFTRG
ncbi:pectinesterase-like [Arachis hypogaea]|uniref:pectinesterase-like n=1 Tax=Arachis hypogaea TaxID=3818 RepID=UPI0010FC5CE0|nr:pectinesterase-like [Arachis hypogaea]